jgi:prepilin-type processing-associated H-X9-DG protein
VLQSNPRKTTIEPMGDGPPTVEYASPVSYAKRVRNWWAIVASMLSIAFLLPPFALAAAVVSFIALRRGRVTTYSEKRAAQIALFLGLLGILLTPVELLGLRWVHQKADVIRCQSQMSALTQCIFMYANNNGGQLPPDLITLASEESVPPPVFVCGRSHDMVASSVAGMSTPGHLSYTYLRSGNRLSDIKHPAAEIVLYEQPNHFGGLNAAFYDGHVEFIAGDKAMKVLAELHAGQNPPPSLSGP